MVRAGAFLVEFLSGGARRPLSHLTAEPVVSSLPVPGVAADRYAPASLRPGIPLVLVHGLSAAGKDDPRLREAARLLARAGFDVAVPTVAGLTVARLRPEDTAAVVATIDAHRRPTVVMGVSVGAGPALLAAADPRVRDRVRTVVSLGGYASAVELVRYYLTGRYALGDERGTVALDPEAVRLFIAANADLLDESARRLLAADPARFDEQVRALSPALRQVLDALSPERVVRSIPARLVLVHGRGDPAVPYTETRRLAAARPARTTAILVGMVAHVEGATGGTLRTALRDGLALWTVMYGLIGER